MRLLKLESNGEFSLTANIINPTRPYAILSHTWGPDGEEVVFKDLKHGSGKTKDGYKKLRFCGEQAASDGLQFFWVDTCCIDKSSSAELQEAINSMFRWYRDAAKCYVYLSDVSTKKQGAIDQLSEHTWESAFRASRWFTRGWTLQELLAPGPNSVEFFSREGGRLGDKRTLEKQIHKITGIPISALRGTPLSQFDVDDRLSWAEQRQTTREEDMAYSLLGIFDIQIPLLYGEGGEKALKRLREEISKPSDENDWLHSLYTMDYVFHRSTIPKPVSGTCRWFLGHPKYRRWMETPGYSSLLWVSGDPGCGKSVLSSFLIDVLSQQEPSKPAPPTVLWFFCDDKIQEHREASAILRGILHQLLSVRQVLLKRHGANCFAKKGTRASKELIAMWDLFMSVSGDKDCGDLVVVIDALDECEELSRSRFLSLVTNLFSMTSTTRRGNSVKFLITSRPSVSIADSFDRFQEVRLKAEDETDSISKDVAVMVQQRLYDTLRRFNTPEPVIQKLQDKLIKHAGHTFLWVALVLQMMERSAEASEEALERIVKDLPDGLDGIYEKILERASGRNREKARAVLHAIVAAFRPLDIAELNIIISLRPGDTFQEDFRVRLEPNMERTLQMLCGPFLKITDSKIYLVHQTAKEFLIRSQAVQDSTAWMHSLDPVDSHLTIGQSCVLYLRIESNRNKTVQLLLGSKEFYDYACQYWSEHVLKCEERLVPPVLQQAVLLCNPRGPNMTHHPWPRLLPERRKPQTHLSIAGAFGLKRAAEALLHQGHSVHQVDGQGLTALDFAILGSRLKVVKFLLESGADPQAGLGARKCAVLKRDSDILQMLLARGVPLSPGGREELLVAAETGHAPLTAFLLARGVRPNITINDLGEMALLVVAKHGQKGLVQMLLDAGADICTRDALGRTALHIAAENGQVSVVRLLVANKAPPNWKDNLGETALARASKAGYREVVVYLLDNGADPNLRDNIGWTALEWASMKGDEVLVTTLLRKTKISNDQTLKSSPGWWARKNGHIRVAEILEAAAATWSNSPRTRQAIHTTRYDHSIQGMVVPLEINKKLVQATIGTGAGATIVSQSCATECGLHRLIDRRFAGVARGISDVEIIGRIHSCQIQLAGISYPCSLTVIRQADFQLILGLDFLRRHQCVIDFRKNSLGVEAGRAVVPIFDSIATRDIERRDGGNSTGGITHVW